MRHSSAVLQACSITPEPTRPGVLLAPCQVAKAGITRAVWVFGCLVVPEDECPPDERAAWLGSLFVTSVTEDDQLANVAGVAPSGASLAAPFATVAGADGARWVTLPFFFDLETALGRPLFDDGMYLTVSARRYRAPIQRVGAVSAAVSDEAGTLFSPAWTPKLPTDHLPLAYGAMRAGDAVRATRHFQSALRADVVRDDLGAAHLFNAACAASLAAAAATSAAKDDLAALGLEWIADDVKKRREHARVLEAMLERPIRAAQREALEAERAAVAAQIEQAATGDPDLAALRAYAAFPEVIAERAPG